MGQNTNFALTPEQIAQARKLGSNVQTQSPPTQQQNVVPSQPQQTPQPQPQPQQTQTVQETQVVSENTVSEDMPEATDLIEGEKQTYFVIEGTTSVLELDLMIFREKNQENRYFTMKIHHKDEDGGTKKVTNFVIDNPESFQRLKNYFTNLNWQD